MALRKSKPPTTTRLARTDTYMTLLAPGDGARLVRALVDALLP